MNEMQVFKNTVFGEVRTMVIDGEPWFVGNDIATVLGYKDPKAAIRDRVDEDDKTVFKGGDLPLLDKNNIDGQRSENATFEIPNRGMTFINESGVYSLIFGSQLESAKQFKHWVTHEVLPTIRKHGYYSAIPDNQLILAIISAADDKDRYPLVIEAIRAAKIDQSHFVSDLMGLRQTEIPKKLTTVSNENRHGQNLLSDWKKYHYGDYTAKDLYSKSNIDDYLIDAAVEKCARKKSDFAFYNFIKYCGEIHFTRDGYLAVLDYIDKMGYLRSQPGVMKEWRQAVKNARD